MRVSRWQIVVSLALTFGILILAYLNWDTILESIELLGQAQPAWLVLVLVIEIISFFVASRVYHRVLRSLGYRMGVVRLWAIALVAIILSQSIPAGGVASYAFLVQTFRRRGVSSGHSALIASLEALSYAAGMLALFVFGIVYIIVHTGGLAEGGAVVAALVGMLFISAVVFLLTRDQAVLAAWLLGIKRTMAWVFRRQWDDAGILKIVDELVRGRTLIVARRSELVWLVGIQVLAMVGHSLAMLVVLYSLGETTSILVVMSAFGVALVSSTFNVLPGGGGTVEATMVLVLQGMGVGAAAITAAIIFRLLNFWLMMPVAALCYRWLMHGREPVTQPVEV